MCMKYEDSGRGRSRERKKKIVEQGGLSRRKGAVCVNYSLDDYKRLGDKLCSIFLMSLLFGPFGPVDAHSLVGDLLALLFLSRTL